MCVHYEWSNEGKQAQKSLRELINDAASHKTNFCSLFTAKLAIARWWKFVLASWLRKWLVSGWLWILRLFLLSIYFVNFPTLSRFKKNSMTIPWSSPLFTSMHAILTLEQNRRRTHTKNIEGSKKQNFFLHLEHVEKGNNLLLFSKFWSQ